MSQGGATRTVRPSLSSYGVIKAGPIAVDVTAHRTWIEGREVELSPIEFDLLVALMTHRGRVQSRHELLKNVWHRNPDGETRTVDMHMSRLRAKLGACSRFIETIRGVGYRFSSAPKGHVRR